MKSICTLLLVLVPLVSSGEEAIDIWEGSPPYSKANTLEEYVKESWGVPCVHNVTKPTLTIHPAKGENSGRAMVVLPGGGYVLESFLAEGREIAEYLSSRGITAAVLKYRLPMAEASDQPHLVPLTDARRAISLMKSMADDHGFDPSKVGIMGFSAGGHLAAAASVLTSDNDDEIPDFSALIYPVTTMAPENRKWLEEDLFHRPMTAEEQRQYSLVDNVTAETPPAFLLHAYDDDVVPISESIVFAEALTAVGQDVEVHFFAEGGHGFGPGRPEDGTAQWLGLLADWIKRQ
jgi:acetyl esterase/lipase